MALRDPLAMLDMLEFMIAQKDEVFFGANQCAIALEQRRDLNPRLHRMVLHERMICTLLERNFDDARQRAEFLLRIQEEPAAEMVLWALAAARGDSHAAAKHFCRGVQPDSLQYYYQYLGAWAVGLPNVDNYSMELHDADEALHEKAQKLIAALEAQE